MSTEYFRIDEHTLDASHIRGFPRTTSTHQTEVLQLAIKQYTPLNNSNPQPGDITIIAAHANAFPKVTNSSNIMIDRSIIMDFSLAGRCAGKARHVNLAKMSIAGIC